MAVQKYERVETSDPDKREESKEEEDDEENVFASVAGPSRGVNYQTVSSSSAPKSLTANQMAQLAEWEELNSFRDGVFECTENMWPSCICSFCCQWIHLGQLASRLGVAPCWVPPVLFGSLALLIYFYDGVFTECLYLAVAAAFTFWVRLRVRRYFRPNPGVLGDFSQLPVTSTTSASTSGAAAAPSLSSQGISGITNSTDHPARGATVRVPSTTNTVAVIPFSN